MMIDPPDQLNQPMIDTPMSVEEMVHFILLLYFAESNDIFLISRTFHFRKITTPIRSTIKFSSM